MSKLPANIELIDPLGEVRARAKELWVDAGSPSDKNWEEFYTQAEQQLLAGSAASSSDSTLKAAKPSKTHPAIAEAGAQNNNLQLSVIAGALQRPLDAHEAAVLGDMLTTFQFKFADGSQIGPVDPEQASEILAPIAGEYDESFLMQHGTKDPFTIELGERQRYWNKFIKSRKTADEARSNADRNTLARLLTSISSDQRIREIS